MLKTLSLSLMLTGTFFFLVPSQALAKIQSDNEFYFSTNASTGYIKPKRSPYLGTQIGASPNRFNFVEAGGKMSSHSKGLSFGYKAYKGLNIFGELEDTAAHASEFFETLDPQGQNLLIPGVGVGAIGVGFLLPGPNNQVTNPYYKAKIDYYRIKLGVQKDLDTPVSNLMMTPSFGVSYGRSITKNLFSGDIPFFTRNFAYNSKADIRTISPTIGLHANYQYNSLLQFFGGAEYSYDFNQGKGLDSLAFTGFADQKADIKNDKNTDSYGFNAGITVTPRNFPAITFEGNYKKLGNVPVIQNRNGTDKSDISYKNADQFNATMRIKFEF